MPVLNSHMILEESDTVKHNTKTRHKTDNVRINEYLGAFRNVRCRGKAVTNT